MKRALSVDEEILSSSAKKECHERNGKLPTITSLDAPVSPPRRRSRPEKQPPAAPAIAKRGTNTTGVASNSPPNLAAIEAGQVEVSDHLSIFSSHLSQCIRPSTSSDIPRLQISDWKDLYRRNERLHGRHFVVHQHDHPIAGPHYDLRLQFSESSSVSWSVMYGLPGDPNSRRLNRNATETRVHCFWVCSLDFNSWIRLMWNDRIISLRQRVLIQGAWLYGILGSMKCCPIRWNPPCRRRTIRVLLAKTVTVLCKSIGARVRSSVRRFRM